MKKAAKNPLGVAEEIGVLKKKIRDLEQAETRRKLTDVAMQQEYVLFQDLVNTLPVGVYRVRVFPRDKWRQGAWDAPGSAPYAVELASDRFCEILGITRSEFERSPGIIEGMVHPEDKEEFVGRNIEAATRLTPFQWEGRLRVGAKDIWVHFESLPRPLASGDVIWTGFLLDISARRLAERTLRESEARYESLANVSPVGIFRTDLEGSTNYVNPMWCQIAGIPAAETMGLGWLKAVHPDDRERLARGWQEAASRQHASATDYRLQRPDGTIVWVMGQAMPEKDSEGRISGYVGTITDISERKRAEAEREKLQALFLNSQKMESIGRLAGGVAHDLNNMLEVILIHAGMAVHELPPGHPLQDSLRAINQAAGRSAELTRQLLAFARRQTANPRLIDLNVAVARTLDMLRRLIGEDKSLEWRPAAGLGPVRIDPQQLVQVLTNLCLNARDAITGVGRITLTTSSVSLDEAACAPWPEAVPGGYARLAVGDSGCGMTPEVRERIFEPFFTTKPLGRGTGLGLPAVYGIVQQNHGFITVESAPGQGSVFVIHLPLQAGTVQAEEEPPRWRGHLRGSETILVVEDEPAILEIVGLLLRQAGYTVLEANSPGAALRLAEEHGGAIDLLLSDLVLPEMDGRELSRRLEAGRSGPKRLFMSGHAADIIAAHGVSDDAANFIAKPFSMDELLAKVRETLGKK